MKKKGLILILLLFQMFIIKGYSQTLLKTQYYYFYYDGVAKPRVTISSYHKVSPKFYFSTYFYINPGWSQGLMGFDYSPGSDFMIGMKAGIQSESNIAKPIDVLRVSAFIYYRLKKISFASIYEIGGIKDRAIALLDYNFKQSSAGVMFIKKGKFLSIGPRTDIKIPKTPLYIYLSALITKDGKFASMSGIYARFKSHDMSQIEQLKVE